MRNILTILGNIPVTSSVIASLFPEVKTKSAKVAQLEKAGEIIRLRRNLFVVNPQETKSASFLWTYSQPSVGTILCFYADRIKVLRTDTRSCIYSPVYDI